MYLSIKECDILPVLNDPVLFTAYRRGKREAKWWPMINSGEVATMPMQFLLLISDREKCLMPSQAHCLDMKPRLNHPSLGFSLTKSYFPIMHFFLPHPKTFKRKERGTLHSQICPLSKKTISYMYEAHFLKSSHSPLTKVKPIHILINMHAYICKCLYTCTL